MVILKIVKAKDRRKTLIEENNSEDEEKYNKQIKVVKKIKKIGIKTSLKIKRRDEDSISNLTHIKHLTLLTIFEYEFFI